jgi:hypothetical protein
MKIEDAPVDPQTDWFPNGSSLKGALEIIAASVSVLAATGYVSLRAFSNFLGLAGVQDLTVQQLLFECYAVSGAFVIVAVPALCIEIVLCMVLNVFGRLVRRWPLVRVRTDLYGSAIIEAGFASFAFLVLGLTIGIYSSLTTEVLLEGVGQLRAFRPHPELFIGAVGLTLLLISLTLSSQIAAKVEKFKGIAVAQTARAMAGALAIFYIWISAITYNVHFRQPSFPIALVRPASSSGTVLCGLLVYATDQTRFLWRIVGDGETARGEISAVPRQPLDQLDLLASRSVVKIADDIFDGRQGIPECSNLPTSPFVSPNISKSQ